MPIVFTATRLNASAAGAAGASGLSMILMLVAMFAIMYFLMIRPENKRKKQAEEMRAALKKGDQITTIGGIIGRIVWVGDDTIVIETSDDRVRMELTKWAVSVNNSQQPADTKKGGKKAKAEEPAPEPEKLEDGADK